MSDPAVTNLIREVLSEELSKARPQILKSGAAGNAITVTIANDTDLQAFAKRMLALTANPQTRKDIEQGHIIFRLAGSPAVSSTARTAGPGQEDTIERGFVSERQIDRLTKGTKRLLLGKSVRLTPLARDRLRQRGIVIERMDT